MMAQQNSETRKQENAEQKLQRQVEVVNSVAKTAIDVINRILKDPDSLVAYQVLQKSALSLKQALEKGPQYFSKLFYTEVSEEMPLIAHSKNVAVLAVRLGMTQKLSSEQLNNLAIAAMIHDIGLTQIPKEQNPIEMFLTTKDNLSSEQRKLHLAHVKESVNLIEDKDFIPKAIIDLIENHEENLSGQGPLEKTQLPIEQQILSLTNRFEKCMRIKKISPNKAIQELAINELGNYDLQLIESLKKMAAALT
jgi:HD-GYP domain-containing protein (c-di-GMP phosphodiesterase class II)